MQIKDLTPRQGNVDVIIEVVSIDEPREFNKPGLQGKVANALAKDETGQIKITLWNEQIDNVKPGVKIHIQKGYVNEWQGEMQLTTGKFGTLDVLDAEASIQQQSDVPVEDKIKDSTNITQSPVEALEDGLQDIDEEEVL